MLTSLVSNRRPELVPARQADGAPDEIRTLVWSETLTKLKALTISASASVHLDCEHIHNGCFTAVDARTRNWEGGWEVVFLFLMENSKKKKQMGGVGVNTARDKGGRKTGNGKENEECIFPFFHSLQSFLFQPQHLISLAVFLFFSPKGD